MGRLGCCLIVLFFIIFIVLDALLFAYFIGRYDTEEIKISTGDMMRLKSNLSTFWCDGVQIESALQFKAYQLDSFPKMRDLYKEEYSYKSDTSYTKLEYSLYKFYLLEGSKAKISLCSTEPAVILSIFNSDKDVSKCIKKRSSFRFDDSNDNDFEDHDLKCPGSILSTQVLVESDCESSKWKWWKDFRKGMDVATIDAIDNGYYYVLVQNFYYRTNVVKMQMNISRSVFEVRNSDQKCTDTKKCYLGFKFWSSDSIVVQMNPLDNLVSTSLYYTCDFNDIAMICVFLVIPLVVILLVSWFYCCCCRKKNTQDKIYVKEDKNNGNESLVGSIDVNSEDNSVFGSVKNYGATSQNPSFNYDFGPGSSLPQKPKKFAAQSEPNYYPNAPPPSYFDSIRPPPPPANPKM